ncbi:DUF2795 domain-containing protein [Streptomyces violens]|uniref:DUF2795 domain-containing protein n=1 Tax=Streptomyces violens TaxID=66377 RepID=UPI001FE0E817|nr:DUF2795 domain-containing protein [Streptomyces violens]
MNPIEMQKCLGGVDYPASKDEIMRQAEQHGASKDIMGALKKLPETDYESPAAVNREVGKE